jgi:hypothetical protein
VLLLIIDFADKTDSDEAGDMVEAANDDDSAAAVAAAADATGIIIFKASLYAIELRI